MKKIIYGLGAVALAVAGSAFTTRTSFVTDYYFPLNPTTGAVEKTTSTPPQSATSYGCGSGASFCAAAFTQYVTVTRGSDYSAVVSSAVSGSTLYKN